MDAVLSCSSVVVSRPLACSRSSLTKAVLSGLTVALLLIAGVVGWTSTGSDGRTGMHLSRAHEKATVLMAAPPSKPVLVGQVLLHGPTHFTSEKSEQAREAAGKHMIL